MSSLKQSYKWSFIYNGTKKLQTHRNKALQEVYNVYCKSN